MRKRPLIFLAGALLSWSALASDAPEKAILWRNPQNIESRDLFNGPGGMEHQPSAPFRFIEEDLHGTNPKFIVEDSDGIRWTAKLGAEARPETAATRIIWAAGYFATEDYLLTDFRVSGMPRHLHRGQRFIRSDGSMANVRLKRHSPGEKKVGEWQWNESPFAGTREFNGLRVLMALINNWDVTDDNNAVFEKSGERVYLVSDVGSSLGTGNLTWPLRRGRGDLHAYDHSQFVAFTNGDCVDFHEPARPALFFLFTPHEYFAKLRLEWVGRHIPRQDARWLGDLLHRLSHEQIADAFRAAGYQGKDIDLGVSIIERRIAVLESL